LLTVFFEKTVDFRSNECSPKSNLLFGEADISASKRLFAFSTSYIHYNRKILRKIAEKSVIGIDIIIKQAYNLFIF
ncbi:MAG: hypothetical protein IJP16_02755, partial [Clostridia bacterium]|nr:hypothetical protein [Clostridia bacterium]